MRRFFRESILGILLISFLGSLLAAIVGPYISVNPQVTGSALRELLVQPIPALTLLPYSLAILLVLAGYLYWQNRRHSQQVSTMRSASEGDLADLQARNRELESSDRIRAPTLSKRESDSSY